MIISVRKFVVWGILFISVALCIKQMFFAEIEVSVAPVYLEIKESDSDSFAHFRAFSKRESRAFSFFYKEGKVLVNEGFFYLKSADIARKRFSLEQFIEVDDFSKAKVFLVNEVTFKGQGRKKREQVFYAGGTFPFVVRKPVVESEADLKEVRIGEGGVEETCGLRFWQGDLEVLNVFRDGSVDLLYRDIRFSLKKGEERVLSVVEKKLRVIQQGLNDELYDLGDVVFSTELKIKNFGRVKVKSFRKQKIERARSRR